MTAKLRQARQLVRQYGVRRCAWRMGYVLRRRTGLLKRRLPVWRWQDRPLACWLREGVPAESAAYVEHRSREGGRFFFPPGEPPDLPAEWNSAAVGEAEKVAAGTFRWFSCLEGSLGCPPDWLLNPFTRRRTRADVHWADRTDFDPRLGDIKYVWEPSRFGWAYALVRAYAATGDERHAEVFWRWFESWLAANPPQRGPNWQCGQEVAIRAMSCTFACHAFDHCEATTPDRVAAMAVFLAASAERIEGNIGYAWSQKSNHAVSEAAGLYTVATLFPEFRAAGRWRERSRRLLESEAAEHNWPDGTHTQHSMNYQRMVLQMYLWALRLAELNGEGFSELLRERLAASYRFLYQVQDPATGRVPNYGSNDGAQVLPLSGCEYLDYRPVLQAAHYCFTRKRLYEAGPWDEPLAWLFGAAATRAPVHPRQRESAEFPVGGYSVLRGRQDWAMLRCHSYRTRPGQADMLHLDLWWRGRNVLRDSGSFSYYDPDGDWGRYFIGTSAHNTVRLGGVDQMDKGPRFQWLSAVRSRLAGRCRHGETELWQGEHYGHRRLSSRATHRRTVLRVGEGLWVVIDDVLGRGRERIELFWHLQDWPTELGESGLVQDCDGSPVCVEIAATVPPELDLARGREEPERLGWQSLHYGSRTPAPTLRAACEAPLPVRLVTAIGLGERANLDAGDLPKRLAVSAGEVSCELELAPLAAGGTVVRSLRCGDGPAWTPPAGLPGGHE